MRIDDAADVFCRSFAYTRSFTHPYEFIRVEGLRIMRDATLRKTPRTEEVVVAGLEPEEAIKQIKAYQPPRHFLCVITAPGDDVSKIKQAYKDSGYRTVGSEDFFVRDLSKPITPHRIHVKQVTTAAEAHRIKEAAGRHQIPLHLLGRKEVRLYATYHEDHVAGYVRSIHLTPKEAWASNLVVRPEYRRRGFGTALMNAMLKDNKEAGATHNVLLASHVGSKLYPLLGYEQIGHMLVFNPRRS